MEFEELLRLLHEAIAIFGSMLKNVKDFETFELFYEAIFNKVKEFLQEHVLNKVARGECYLQHV